MKLGQDSQDELAHICDFAITYLLLIGNREAVENDLLRAAQCWKAAFELPEIA